jgi:hypothetical protein
MHCSKWDHHSIISDAGRHCQIIETGNDGWCFETATTITPTALGAGSSKFRTSAFCRCTLLRFWRLGDRDARGGQEMAMPCRLPPAAEERRDLLDPLVRRVECLSPRNSLITGKVHGRWG